MPLKVIKVTGGDKYKALLAKIAAQKVGVKAGILAGATTTEGESIPVYAAANEFGAQKVFGDKVVKIPARPFMRQTVKKNRRKWFDALETLLAKNPEGACDAMYVLGEVIRGDIVNEIQNGSFKPNSPATVAAKERKGKSESDHPLIDTGQMMEAVAYEVIEG